MILKTAWRSSTRTSESDIYLLIGHLPKGLAKFVCGGDVISAGHPISVNNLRNASDNNINSTTPILHRLILDTIGLPMWEYKSEIHLLKGFRDALRAHKELCSRGILDCDISAGNVLLADDETAPIRGFITDLEYARIEAATLSKPEKNDPRNVYNNQGCVVSKTEPTTCKLSKFETTVSVKRGAGMTGTAQFLAREILRGVISTSGPVRHEAKHDVESFIWVLSYCVMRSLCHRSSHQSAPLEVREQSKDMLLLFSRAFSRMTTDNIAAERNSECHGLMFSEYQKVDTIVKMFTSAALISLFKNLRGLMHWASDPFNPGNLTHDALLTTLDDAIVLLG